MRIQKNLRERACAKKAWGGGWTIGKPYACRRDCGTLPRRRRPATPAQSTWLFGYIMMECGGGSHRCHWALHISTKAPVASGRTSPSGAPSASCNTHNTICCDVPWAVGDVLRRSSVCAIFTSEGHTFFLCLPGMPGNVHPNQGARCLP